MEQWGRVGVVLEGSAVRVGAVNCVKHLDLCRSFSIGSYPSLIALTYAAAKGETAAEPSIELMKIGKGSEEDILDLISSFFPRLQISDKAFPVQSKAASDIEVEAGMMTQRRLEDATCFDRIEDATVSVRWMLRNDVFSQGTKLSVKRMGESVL